MKKLFKTFLAILAILFPLIGLGQSYQIGNEPLISSDKTDYIPGEIAIISGSGWILDTKIDIVIEENSDPQNSTVYSDISISESGDFTLEFPILERHIGVDFLVKAKGQNSGFEATTTFSDGNITFYSVGTPANGSVAYSGYRRYFFSIQPFSGYGTPTFTIGSEGGYPVKFRYPEQLSQNNIRYHLQRISLSSGQLRSSSDVGYDFEFTVEGTSQSVTAHYGVLQCLSTSGTYGEMVTLSAKFFSNYESNETLSGKNISFYFYINGVPRNVGMATTDAYGNAYLTIDLVNVPDLGKLNKGEYTIMASFGGDEQIFDVQPYYSMAGVLRVHSRPIYPSFIANDKVYDGSTSATGVVILNNLLEGDQVTSTYSNARFGYWGVGNHTVFVEGISIGGNSSNNYYLSNTYTYSSAKITPLNIKGVFSASNKVYNGNENAIVTNKGLIGILSGDNVILEGGNAVFESKNIGNNKEVNLLGPYLSGWQSNNYNLEYVIPTTASIFPAPLDVSIVANNKIYDATTAVAVSAVNPASGLIPGDDVTVTASNGTFDSKDVGTGKSVTAEISIDGVDANNYTNNSIANTTADITPASLIITANNSEKNEGQANPPFTVTYGGFVGSEDETVLDGTLNYSTDANISSCAGPYDVIPSGLTSSNYSITYIDGILTILGISIDASTSSTPVPTGQPANLTATVTPNVAGVSVTFEVTNEANTIVYTNTVLTNGSGVATATTGNLGTVGVYKVTATVGSGCATSTAYIPIYDASGSFVTGGGWINSPSGAFAADESLVGKANFGFVSRYKKGSSQVDGNTEFQFHAGNLNFKSTMHESGSLVISGKKATYRGTGTINGQSGFKFVVVAIDGNWNGQSIPDAFRIKISTTSGAIIYDNQIGSDENTENATILGNNGTGGGSIVIHEVKPTGSKRIAFNVQEVPWNTPFDTIEKDLIKMSKDWFGGYEVVIKWDRQAYDQMASGFYQIDGFLQDNIWFDTDEAISVPITVLDKPMATDIVLESNMLPVNIQAGQAISLLTTIDPADNFHTYSMDENQNFYIDGNNLMWKGNNEAENLMKAIIHSTDRAGQTISKEVTIYRETKPNEIHVYPNPASIDFNIQVTLSQGSDVTIRIFDSAGRMVYQEESYQQTSFVRNIDLKGLSNGMYHILVKVDHHVMTKRLLKQ